MNITLNGILIFICSVIFLILLLLLFSFFKGNVKNFLIYIILPLTLALVIVCTALLMNLIIKLDQKLDDNIADISKGVNRNINIIDDRVAVTQIAIDNVNETATHASTIATQAVQAAEEAKESITDAVVAAVAAQAVSEQNNAALGIVKDNLTVIQGNTHTLATNIDYVHQNLSIAINETILLLDESEQEVVYNPPPLAVEKINLTSF
jgi:hypothetical protein